MDIVPIAVAVALVAVSIAAALVGRHRVRSGRRSRAGIRPVLVMVGGPPPAALTHLPTRSTATSARLFAATRDPAPAPAAEPEPTAEAEPTPAPDHTAEPEPTAAPAAVPVAPTPAPTPAPALDLTAYSALDIERSVTSGTGALIDALVATGELGTSGPVTDAEVRTLVFVSVAATELLQVLLEARPELPA